MREQSRDRHLMLVETIVQERTPLRRPLRARVVNLLEGLMAPLARRRAPEPTPAQRPPPRIHWEM